MLRNRAGSPLLTDIIAGKRSKGIRRNAEGTGGRISLSFPIRHQYHFKYACLLSQPYLSFVIGSTQKTQVCLHLVEPHRRSARWQPTVLCGRFVPGGRLASAKLA